MIPPAVRLLAGLALVGVALALGTLVTLSLRDPHRVPYSQKAVEGLVPLGGTLDLATSWGIVEPRLHVHRLRTREGAVPQVSYDWIPADVFPWKPEGHAWSTCLVEPGWYEVTLQDPPYRHLLEVGPEGLTDAAIEIGDPAEVFIDFRDVETGEPVLLEEVLWSPHLLLRSTIIDGGHRMEHTTQIEDAGTLYCRAPPGQLELSGWSNQFWPHHAVVAVASGENAITIDVERTCGFLLSVQEGHRPLPYEKVRNHIDFTRVENDVQVPIREFEWQRIDDPSSRMAFGEPGFYCITLSDMTGYEPIEPIVIEIEKHEFVEHVVQLTPVP